MVGHALITLFQKMKLLLLSFFSFLTAALFAHDIGDHEQPPWQAPSQWPDRIITTLSGDPATEFSVNWRTDISVGVAIAEIVKADPSARFDINAITRRGETTHLKLDHMPGLNEDIQIIENQGLPPVHYHSVTFSGLEPDTQYAYRVRGTQGKWSPWRQLKTASKESPAKFIFFGDAQTGIRSHVTRTFDAAARVAADADFAIHGGDLVNTATYDKEWAEWFAALGRMHLVIPSIPVAGNHDYVNLTKADNPSLNRQESKLFAATKIVTPIWRPQFTLPVVEELPEELHETVYDIRYNQDLHIFVIDSNATAFDQQMMWLESELSKTDARWKVVTMHHPLFSFIGGTEHPAHKKLRMTLLEVMARNDIDLVLTGHRHSYQRGVYGDGVARYTVGEKHAVDTVFLITASSTKRGASKVDGWERFSKEQDGDFKLDRHGDNVPIFGVFEVTQDTMTYTAFDPLGDEYDGFTLSKDADGNKTIEDHPIALTEPYTHENTSKYIPWDDLR